jgi:hypothetical protein
MAVTVRMVVAGLLGGYSQEYRSPFVDVVRKAAVKRGSPTNDEGVQPSLMTCQKLRPIKCMRDFEPMTLGPHICGALSGSKAIPAQHFDTAYHIATSHTHTSLYTYSTVTPTPQAYARQEEDKPEARAVCGVRDWRLVYPEGAEELGRTYLVVLPLCVFSHGFYDGLAISISFKPRRMPNRQ